MKWFYLEITTQSNESERALLLENPMLPCSQKAKISPRRIVQKKSNVEHILCFLCTSSLAQRVLYRGYIETLWFSLFFPSSRLYLLLLLLLLLIQSDGNEHCKLYSRTHSKKEEKLLTARCTRSDFFCTKSVLIYLPGCFSN